MVRLSVLAALLPLCFSLAAAPRYQAHIRRTTYGIPHIEAKDFGGLGFGEGYAQAEDHLCSVADQVIRARGERAKYFGAGGGDEHLRSDITMKALDLTTRAATMLAKLPPELRDWYTGYAAGYNHYLALTGKDKIGGWCRGAAWVMPITATDLAAYQQIILLVTTQFAPMIATAAPPSAAAPSSAAFIPYIPPGFASNGWGIGRDRSAGGRGMLLANPHYPWAGSNRFWEKHLRVDGKLDVYGSGLIGAPGVAIGFNRDVAWTHTVSAGKRFTLYTLELAPGKPTVYLYDKHERAMTARRVTIEVKQPDGGMKTVSHTVWFSHYGPIINFPNFAWDTKRAIAIRDANWDNTGSAAQWLAMGRARSMKEFQAAHARYQAMPWVNTISSGREGIAWYTDSAATPNLSTEAIAAWLRLRRTDSATKRLYHQGIVLLPGNDSRFEWRADKGARSPGVIAFSRMPQLERTDYVFNANDSFWLANAGALITGPYSPLAGEQATARSLRTRNNALTLSLRSPDQPAGPDHKFTLDELGNAILSNRSLTAELLKDELVARCRGVRGLAQACEVLAGWDNRDDLESRGAVLFREWLGQFARPDFLGRGNLFAVDFDPADPVGTPRGLTPGEAPIENLTRAANLLRSRGIALDVPLGELQYAAKGGRRIPMHGGDGFTDGLMNMERNARNTTTLEPMDYPRPVNGSPFLTEKGYPVVTGSSFLMAVEFTARGPRAKAFLTYSESGDPASPHFADQTELFRKKQWRPVLFEEQDIAAAIERDYAVSGSR